MAFPESEVERVLDRMVASREYREGFTEGVSTTLDVMQQAMKEKIPLAKMIDILERARDLRDEELKHG